MRSDVNFEDRPNSCRHSTISREEAQKGTSAGTESLQTVSDFDQKESDSFRHSTNPENEPGRAKRERRENEKGEEQNP